MHEVLQVESLFFASPASSPHQPISLLSTSSTNTYRTLHVLVEKRA